jgi:hypothetical protein
MRAMRFRVTGLGFLAAIAIAVAGCGGGNSGTNATGASLVRSNVLAFVSVNSDLGSSQWRQVANLVRKFPSGSQLLTQVQTAGSSQGVTYKKDIAPALGPEVDFVVSSVATSGATPSSASFVVMTKPKDEGKLKKLLAKASQTGSKIVTKKVNGWYVFSTNQANLDQALKKSGKSLGDEGSFSRAMKALPSNALIKTYVSGKGLTNIVKSAAASTSGLGANGASALGNLDFLGLALSAEKSGFKIVGAAKGGTASAVSSSATYTSKLVSQIPSGSLAVLSARGGKNLSKQFTKALQNPSIGPQLQQVQTALGVTPQQLLSLLENEIAFYVRPSGTKLPEFSLLLEEPNGAQALSTVNTLMTKVATLTRKPLTPAPGGGKTLKLGKYALTFGGFDSRIILSSALSAVADAQAGGSKLSDDPTFKSAKAAAGVPDKTGGFLYLNLKDGIPLIEAYQASRGQAVSTSTQANLKPLQSMFAYASSSGGVGKFTLFLQIK